MTKKFTLLQLFSLLDGRLSTRMDDVYEMLDHICDTSLMTHHLPVAMNYIKEKKPKWFQECQKRISEMGMTEDTPFEVCLAKFKNDNPVYDIPQLKDEFDMSDFGQYMIDNSLLLKRLKKEA